MLLPKVPALAASLAALLTSAAIQAQTTSSVPQTGPVAASPGPASRPLTAAGVRAPIIETAAPREMVVGDVKTIGLPGVARIAIGNGSLLKATVVDGNQIVLLAEAPGETTMHVWLKSGRQMTYALRIKGLRNDQLLSDLNSYIAGISTLKTSTVGDRIILEGRYPDTETAAKIKALTESFPQVLNLVAAKPADADPLQLERMVQLDLRVVEVKKRALDQLGIKWASTANGPIVATNVLGYANTPWRPAALSGFPAVNTAHPAATYVGLATQITSALNFLEQRGDAWTLAEPRLSCKSGGESKFIAGGEIPIPVPQGNGSIGVEYKQYGVVIEFKPVADGGGNIQSGIVVEVSEPDTRNSNGGFIAFTTNRAETEVALRQGEPLIIAGLLRQKVDKSSDAIPGIGRIPVLEYLFGAKEARTEQTELFLVVTPRVVTPEGALNKIAMDQMQGLTDTAQKKLADRIEPATSIYDPQRAPAWKQEPIQSEAAPAAASTPQ